MFVIGFGDWGLGIGDWAQSPIPNPQSPFLFYNIIILYKFKLGYIDNVNNEKLY